MKRSGFQRAGAPTSYTSLRRTRGMPRPTKPIARHARMKRENAERQAKRRAEYTAFMQSPEWRAIRRAAIARAGRRCEHLDVRRAPGLERADVAPAVATRCEATTGLTVHHLTYARFGGGELPEDLQVLCRAHHDAVHAAGGRARRWQRARRSA